MKEKIRNIFPGGNTPKGFYSYYDYIIDYYDANRIFCIKGGPGTGKSTMMKEIGKYYLEKGESIEFMRCSADPESLDGVVLKNKKVAVIDGTAPHVTDPAVPGAIDEIINIGNFWNEEELKKNRKNIMECRESIQQAYKIAYMYLASAGEKYSMMKELLNEMISQEAVRELNYQLNTKIDGVAMIRRAENKIVKNMAVGSFAGTGKCRKLFAGAITFDGIRSELPSITSAAKKIILLKVPLGFRTENLLKPVSQRLRNASFDVEEYYCPMDPENKLEHIVCPEIGLAVVTSNHYHNISETDSSRKIVNIELEISEELQSLYGEVYRHVSGSSKEDIDYAVRYLAFAKEYHDELESCYIPNMDFEKLSEIREQIIAKIDQLTV